MEFHRWPVSTEEAVVRIEEDWTGLGHPLGAGDVAWFRAPNRLPTEELRASWTPRWLDYTFAVAFAVLAPISLVVYEPLTTKLLMAAGNGLVSVFSWRSAHAGVSISPEHLVIRNIWTTRQLAWSNIADIGVRKLLLVRSFAYVATTSGKQVTIWAVTGARWYDRDNFKVVSVVRRLREALYEAHGSAMPTTGSAHS